MLITRDKNLVIAHSTEKIIEYLRQNGLMKQHILCQACNINIIQITDTIKNDEC